MCVREGEGQRERERFFIVINLSKDRLKPIYFIINFLLFKPFYDYHRYHYHVNDDDDGDED